MRKTFSVLTAVALALTLTTPAMAKPKHDPPGKPPAYEGLTCAEFFGSDDSRVVVVGETGEASVVMVRRGLKEACFDVPTGGTWTITLAPVPGAADPTEVLLRLEDSMPGDACHQESLTPYESLTYDMPSECVPPDGEPGWSDSDAGQQALYAYMVGPGHAAVEVTLKRSDS